MSTTARVSRTPAEYRQRAASLDLAQAHEDAGRHAEAATIRARVAAEDEHYLTPDEARAAIRAMRARRAAERAATA